MICLRLTFFTRISYYFLKFYLWNYHCNISPFPSFFQSHHAVFPRFLQIHSSFYTNCYRIHTGIDTGIYIYIPKPNPLNWMMLPVCIYVLKANPVILGSPLVCCSLGEDHHFCFQLSRGTCSSLCGVDVLWVFKVSLLACPLVFPLFSSHLGGHIGKTLRMKDSYLPPQRACMLLPVLWKLVLSERKLCQWQKGVSGCCFEGHCIFQRRDLPSTFGK